MKSNKNLLAKLLFLPSNVLLSSWPGEKPRRHRKNMQKLPEKVFCTALSSSVIQPQTPHDSELLSGGHSESDVLKSFKCGQTHGAGCRLHGHKVQQVRGPRALTSHPAPCEAPWVPLHLQASPNSSTYHHNILKER